MWTFMLRRFLLTGVLVLVTICGWAQQQVVSGTVFDTDTRKPLAGASITAGGLSVVTNDDGFFTLKSDQALTALTATHIGYRARHVKVGGEEPLRIFLKSATIQLSEVMVMGGDARELVLAAMSRIPENYSQRSELYHCFYREKVMKRSRYISVAEGVVDMFKNGYQYAAEHDRAAIRKGRRLLSPKRNDTLSVKVVGGPATALMLDVVKNQDFLLSAEELGHYELQMETPTVVGDRRQLVVSLRPRVSMPYALYYGKMYIDERTLAFTRFELSLDMKDQEKATRVMLVSKPRGLRFKPKELSMVVDYRTDADGVTRVSYLRTTFRFNCDWKRRLFATSFAAECEMVVTSSSGGDVKPIKGRDSFDQRDAFFDKVDYFRDPAFWQDYNIIEPTESLDEAVRKLLKGQR